MTLIEALDKCGRFRREIHESGYYFVSDNGFIQWMDFSKEFGFAGPAWFTVEDMKATNWEAY